VVGSSPEKAGRILQDALYRKIGEAVLFAVIAEPELLRLSQNGQAADVQG
jgi:hypothetical protein